MKVKKGSDVLIKKYYSVTQSTLFYLETSTSVSQCSYALFSVRHSIGFQYHQVSHQFC